MKRKQLIPAVLAGTLIGAALVGPASAGVAALTAAPSTQTFYICLLYTSDAADEL